MIETTDIDLNHISFTIEFVFHEGQPAIGSPAVVQAEPAFCEIHSVTIEGATVVYHKPLWDRLSRRVREDYV